MSDVSEITPVSGSNIPPIRPTREVGRDRKKSRREKKRAKKQRTNREDRASSEPDGPSEDEPTKGGSINLRV